MKKSLLFLSLSSLLLAGCGTSSLEEPSTEESVSSSTAENENPSISDSSSSSSVSSYEELSSSSREIESSSKVNDSYYIEILPSSIEETKSQKYLVDYSFSVFDALDNEYEFFGTGIQRGGGSNENTIQCNGKDNGTNPIGTIYSKEPLKGTARIIQLDKGEYTGTPIFEVDGKEIQTEPKIEDGKRTYEFKIEGTFSFRVTPGLAIYLYSIAFFN